MSTIPAPSLVLHQEEWPDADFDLPEGEPIIRTPSTRAGDVEEDWDLEMDLGKTGGAKVQAVVADMPAFQSSSKPQLFTIRPPLPSATDADFDDDDDEGVSTIKVSGLPQLTSWAPPQSPIDEDLESDFSLPPDLTKLSLAPQSLTHRSSKTSLEWGDKDHTSSSQSSDAYSSLGFADASPSSNSTSSVSQPDTENEETEDDEDLEGLVIPSALFDAKQGTRKLTQILELKKKLVIGEPQVKIASPDPEDDFEIGLLIDDDVDLSPSRLLYAVQQPKHLKRTTNRINTGSTMSRLPTPSLRPPSRLKSDRAKSPISRPPSTSTRQLQKSRLSPSPPPSVPKRSHTFQALSSVATPPPTSFLSPKAASLRGQKSHSGLKPPSPPQSGRKLTRKASLSSLLDNGPTPAFALAPPIPSGSKARYEEPTAASRAKSHKNTTSKIHDYRVPPTRPSTPSSNPVALRLTMPTQSRLKLRPALSTLFGSSSFNSPQSLLPRSSSPLPQRPPSAASTRAAKPSGIPQPVAPKVLRRPKRQRTYGDGTELDAIDDLPADREKEARYRVQPKGYGNRIPGGTFSKSTEKSVMRKGKRDGSGGLECAPLAHPSQSLKRTGRIEFASKVSSDGPAGKAKAKKSSSPVTPGHTRRKPTLIRNLGGIGGPKVVGEMKWNPQTLRWEGNDHVLRDFDAAVGTSTRPALITHLTGSSIGSPVASFASGARIVGNMMFDPARMCWISTLPPEEDEPDVFANLADDEDDDDWDAKDGTIRANLQGKAQVSSDTSGSTNSSNVISETSSPAHSRYRAMSDSGSDRCSRASMVYDVDDDFLEACRHAEERHRAEIKGWRAVPSRSMSNSAALDRSYLYDIRALATRKY